MSFFASQDMQVVRMPQVKLEVLLCLASSTDGNVYPGRCRLFLGSLKSAELENEFTASFEYGELCSDGPRERDIRTDGDEGWRRWTKWDEGCPRGLAEKGVDGLDGGMMLDFGGNVSCSHVYPEVTQQMLLRTSIYSSLEPIPEENEGYCS